MSDLIDRQQAIDEIKSYSVWVTYTKGDSSIDEEEFAHDIMKQTKRAILSCLKHDVPSAQPKKGKWIRHSIGHMNIPWGYDCSACGAWFVINDDAFKRYDFCPNCGSDNRGEQDG